MTALACLGALAIAFLQAPSATQPALGDKRNVLRAVAAITTLPAAEVLKTAAATEIEHDSEVARSELVTVVVTIQGCQSNTAGECQATADVVAYKPDGTVHSEMKNIALPNGRGTATLKLAPGDVTGVYKVEATVRDPIARRVAKSERLFGVK